MAESELIPDARMADVLASFPGARRALFKGFHIGGCQSCGFSEEDTLAEVARKHDKDVNAMVEYLRNARQQEAQLLVEPGAALQEVRTNGARLIDLRTPQEFEAHHVDGAELINESFAEEIMAWPRDARIIMYCRDGVGSLNAAAYMTDYGFTRVACVKGGYQALSKAAS
jgi:rhodanese-related sulfurtransferase